MEKRLQTVNHNNLMALWSKRVEACRNSGLTVSEWCEENGISKSTYYTWQRKVFCTMTQGQSAPELVEVPLGQASTRFQPVATLHAGNLSAEIYSSADAGVLEALCRAVEVMLNDFNCSCPIYIACGDTDLRRGIDGLASIVEAQFKMDPFQNAMFLFCGRRRDRLKALYWEGDGFLLLYKRLEQGSFQWPRTQKEVQTLTPQQYRWLMEGLKIEQPKANKAISGVSMT